MALDLDALDKLAALAGQLSPQEQVAADEPVASAQSALAGEASAAGGAQDECVGWQNLNDEWRTSGFTPKLVGAVLEQVADEVGVQAAQLQPETTLASLDVSLLSLYAVASSLENDLKKTVTDRELQECVTLAQLVQCFA